MVLCVSVGAMGGDWIERDLGLFMQIFNNWNCSKIKCLPHSEKCKIIENIQAWHGWPLEDGVDGFT